MPLGNPDKNIGVHTADTRHGYRHARSPNEYGKFEALLITRFVLPVLKSSTMLIAQADTV